MKSSTALTALAATLTAVTATPLPLAKRASNSWGGTNLYFLQGLPDDAQETYLQGLQDAGAKVVRVWGRLPVSLSSSIYFPYHLATIPQASTNHHSQ